MVRNTDFVGTKNSNPYTFRHYDFSNFSLYVNGTQIPSVGLALDTGHEKTTVMGYRTLLEASGIRHSNMGLQITHDMYITGYFMLLLDLTSDRCAAEAHTSHPDSGNIRIEVEFAKLLSEAVTCPLYLEHDNCVRIDAKRFVTTDFS
jgi:hypothetical protein